MNKPGVVEMTDELKQAEIHAFWWIYAPILFFVFRYTAHLTGTPKHGIEAWFRHELGIVENLTVLLLIVALFYTISILIRFAKSLHPLFSIFLIIYCLGCIYFAGEEASWGQHWFGWETTDYFMEHNTQGETNIHNTSSLFDRTPKFILSALIFLGGVIVPIYCAVKSCSINYNKRFWWVWPTQTCLPTGIITSLIMVPEKIEHWSGAHFYFGQAQEMKECYIAYFILIFILSLGRRLARLRRDGQAFSPL